MIYIFYGDDVASSRNNFNNLKKEYILKNYLPILLNQDNIIDLQKGLYLSQGLFNNTVFFFSENIFANKSNHNYLSIFDNKKNIDLIDWGEYQYITAIKNKFKHILFKQSKLPVTVFKFIDSLYPGNLSQALEYHNLLINNIDSYLIFYMVQKHIKDLLLTGNSEFLKTIPSWKQYQLKKQADSYTVKKLIRFYNSLCKLEQDIKTSSTPYTSDQALDILFCYYLR